MAEEDWAHWDYAPEADRPAWRLMDALDRGDLAGLQELIAEFSSLLGRTVYNTDSELIPLEYAAYDGQVEVVRWLLSQGADPNSVSDVGATPLAGAAWQARQSGDPYHPSRVKYFRVMRLLINAGADPNPIAYGDCTVDECHRAIHGVGILDAIGECERRHGPGG